MVSAVFINGIYEGVLNEIIESQQDSSGYEHFLQPHSGRRISRLRDSRPTHEQPVRLYASTTGELETVSFVATIIDWKDKTELSEPERRKLDFRIKKRQPNEGGLYEKGVNLLIIRDLCRLEEPFRVTELILESKRKPPGRRTTAGGFYYVLLHEFDLGQLAESDLSAAESRINEIGEFSGGSIEDTRNRRANSIVQRRGQSRFRERFLCAYRGMCAITGYDAVEALEAAHIQPYMGELSNHVQNGLLLRSDIHVLFDMGLIAIHTESGRVAIAPRLLNTSYGKIDGILADLPENIHLRPSKTVLCERFRNLRKD